MAESFSDSDSQDELIRMLAARRRKIALMGMYPKESERIAFLPISNKS
jgi:hypothetical protein